MENPGNLDTGSTIGRITSEQWNCGRPPCDGKPEAADWFRHPGCRRELQVRLVVNRDVQAALVVHQGDGGNRRVSGEP
jgi:hypothetical protein